MKPLFNFSFTVLVVAGFSLILNAKAFFKHEKLNEKISPEEILNESCSGVVKKNLRVGDESKTQLVADDISATELIIAYAIVARDSPRYTENYIYLGLADSKCRKYKIGGIGYSTAGTFQITRNRVIFRGDSLTCPAPNRTPIEFQSTYEVKNSELYLVERKSQPKKKCEN